MKSFTPLIFIGIAVGLFFLFVDPQYQEVKILQAEIEKNQELIDLVDKLNREKEEVQQKFNQISPEEREKIEKILPDTIDNVRLILDINNIANDFGISIRDIQIQDSNTEKEGVVDKTGKLFGTISLSFSVSARYEVFKDFMQSLENSLRLVDIKSFSVNTGGEGEFYDFKVSINTYWLR